MEKFLIDRDEVLQVIVDTYVTLYHEEKLTFERLAVANFAQVITDKIKALDTQKVEKESVDGN